MGSHFVNVCSVDEERIRGALGSGDRKVLNAWLRAIRKRGKATYRSESDIEGEEEAAECLIAGSVANGKSANGHHYGHAFEVLCELWADDSETVECRVDAACRALVRLASGGTTAPFGVPASPYGVPDVRRHEPSELGELRALFAAARGASAELERYIGPEDIEAIDRVLAHAQGAGRGVIVFHHV
jgi:hypothetical protein